MAETEKCDNCGATLKPEDIMTIEEPRGEFWGAPCSETVAIGYVCSKCGHHEDW